MTNEFNNPIDEATENEATENEATESEFRDSDETNVRTTEANPEALKPIESQKLLETSKTVESQKLLESLKPVETTKLIESTKSTETTKPAETTKPIETLKSIETTDLIEGKIIVAEDGSKKILRRRRPLLEVENLYVQFKQNSVLRDVNLKFRRGETVAIIGESGCGKTVLLKTLIGLIWPTFGRVLFEGQNIAELSNREMTKLRGRYGFVFQMAALFDSMTIGDNVSFPIRQQGTKMKRAETRDFVAHLLNEVGLNPSVIDRTPSELSGGMRKRVGFARALATEPEVMLYDEPTTGLDPIMSDVINELIISARDNRHVTGIIVTHDMTSAKKVADRIVMVYPNSRLAPDEPQVIFDGTPEEIERCSDKRVLQFINGQAGERLMEMAKSN